MGGREASLPRFQLPPALGKLEWLRCCVCICFGVVLFSGLFVLVWFFKFFFADSGQVFGGVCLRRFKTVLDTLRHSSQLPCIGIGEFTKELLRQCPSVNSGGVY